jgi:hypothetical protein
MGSGRSTRAGGLVRARHGTYHSSRYCGTEIGSHHQPRAAITRRSGISRWQLYGNVARLPSKLQGRITERRSAVESSIGRSWADDVHAASRVGECSGRGCLGSRPRA